MIIMIDDIDIMIKIIMMIVIGSRIITTPKNSSNIELLTHRRNKELGRNVLVLESRRIRWLIVFQLVIEIHRLSLK